MSERWLNFLDLVIWRLLVLAHAWPKKNKTKILNVNYKHFNFTTHIKAHLSHSLNCENRHIICFWDQICACEWAALIVLPKDRVREKSNVNQLWWTAAINQECQAVYWKDCCWNEDYKHCLYCVLTTRQSIGSILLYSIILHRQAI